jgi:ABC-2 type transport system ATP-binding protein
VTGPSETAIRVRNLSKVYRHNNPFKRHREAALKPLDLDVPSHQAFGLIGLNGAGKTTLVKILLGLLSPTTGSLEVLGGSIGSRRIRARVGYLPELPYFPRQMTAKELLAYYGYLYGLRGKALSNRVEEILGIVRLEKAAEFRIAEYSKGMQQRVGIGQALIGKPELILCDEPVTGLDPVGYREVREIFLELKRTGTTLFFNTHVLSEVEKICDWVGVLHEGVLRRVARVTEVMAEKLEMDYWVELSGVADDKLRGFPHAESVAKSGGFQVSGRDLSVVLGDLSARGITVSGVRPLSSLVESFFLRTIGRESDLMFTNRREARS